MRIGIISDIHGDMPSLTAAIDCLKQQSVDTILCAGDVVERGSDDHGVISYLRSNEIPCVQGNHDENAVRHSEFLQHSNDPDEQETRLSIAAVDFLRTLPLTRTFHFEQTTLLLAHATPSDNGAPVFQDSSGDALAKKFKKDLARMEADILIVGHTHFPFDIRYKGKRVVNSGSVCNLQSRDSHTCGILDLTNQTFSVRTLINGTSVEFLDREFE
ncbi:MAG: YfcE family phosphodiesterase [Planctomycetaceae bacterium]|nr:YfcE family phosphodiesterase [Planctomycetaceae bacterium]